MEFVLHLHKPQKHQSSLLGTLRVSKWVLTVSHIFCSSSYTWNKHKGISMPPVISMDLDSDHACPCHECDEREWKNCSMRACKNSLSRRELDCPPGNLAENWEWLAGRGKIRWISVFLKTEYIASLTKVKVLLPGLSIHMVPPEHTPSFRAWKDHFSRIRGREGTFTYLLKHHWCWRSLRSWGEEEGNFPGMVGAAPAWLASVVCSRVAQKERRPWLSPEAFIFAL